MRRAAALCAVAGLLLLAAPASAEQLKVMTFNIWYGGVQVESDRIVNAIDAAGPDIVGLQEPEGNLREIAEEAGLSHVDESLHVASRYPIFAARRGDLRFGWVAVAPGKVVAIANLHLPSSPYGPELVRDGRTPAQVLANERATRLGEIRPYLGLPAPGFLVGDFNSPSHLDWIEGNTRFKYPLNWPVSAALAEAGFRDSYREAHPDPVARPGITWTPGTPPPRVRRRETHDRIDWVLSTGATTTLASALVGEPGGPDVDIGVPWGSDHRAVMSTFDAVPAAAPPLADAEPRVVTRGERVAIRYAGVRAGGKRIAILPPRGDRPLMSLPIGDTGDHRAALLGTRGLRPGVYRAGVMGDKRVLASSRFWVQAPGARPRIRTSRRAYAPGETIRLRWSGMPGHKFDWVGIFKARPNFNVYGYYGFKYVDALPSGRMSMTTADTGRLAPGRYVAGLFMDDGYGLLARTGFVIR